VKAGLNLYAYASLNPTNRIDPKGTDDELAAKLTGEQITRIWNDSKGQMADFKLGLGLGPISDKALQGFLSSRSWSIPADNSDKSAPGPSIGPSTVSRDEEWSQRQAREAVERNAQRRKEHPNYADIQLGDTANVAKVVDPSGMGIIKAPVAVIYMATGQGVEEAQRHAGNVDAVAGVLAMLALPRASRQVPQIVVDDPGRVVNTDGVGAQVEFFTENVPGTTAEQASLLLGKSFSKGSNVVLGGSRVRGDFHAGSDLDVGFDHLNTNQSGKVKGPVSKLGPLQLEKTHIVPGNETPFIPEIQSAGEFFQRSGVRAGGDPRAGQAFFPSGSITFEVTGEIHILTATPYRL
jgi:hypothetical protein